MFKSIINTIKTYISDLRVKKSKKIKVSSQTSQKVNNSLKSMINDKRVPVSLKTEKLSKPIQLLDTNALKDKIQKRAYTKKAKLTIKDINNQLNSTRKTKTSK
jgi:hypothetical protein